MPFLNIRNPLGNLKQYIPHLTVTAYAIHTLALAMLSDTVDGRPVQNAHPREDDAPGAINALALCAKYLSALAIDLGLGGVQLWNFQQQGHCEVLTLCGCSSEGGPWLRMMGVTKGPCEADLEVHAFNDSSPGSFCDLNM